MVVMVDASSSLLWGGMIELSCVLDLDHTCAAMGSGRRPTFCNFISHTACNGHQVDYIILSFY